MKNECFAKLAKVFKVLSHPSRLKIAMTLSGENNLCVEDMRKQISCSQCNLSQHLAVLKKYKIVSCKKNGKKVYYSLIKDNSLNDILRDLTPNLH